MVQNLGCDLTWFKKQDGFVTPSLVYEMDPYSLYFTPQGKAYRDQMTLEAVKAFTTMSEAKYQELQKAMSGEYKKPAKLATPDTIDLVVAHGPCSDGLMAAAVARYYANLNKRQIDIVFVNHPIDTRLLLDTVRGRGTLFVDITPGSPETTKQVSQCVPYLCIRDHHKSAMDAHAEQKQPWCHFDLTKSGAVLAWEWFFPGKPLPTMVHAVGERDLGRCSDEVKALTAALYNVEMSTLVQESTLNKYVGLVERGVLSDTDKRELVATGKLVLAENAAAVWNLIEHEVQAIRTERLADESLSVLYMLCPSRLILDALPILRQAHPTVDVFAFPSVYSANGSWNTAFSLRCGRDTTRDLTRITAWMAENKLSIDGGGHPGAARVVRAGQMVYLTGDQRLDKGTSSGVDSAVAVDTQRLD